MVHIDNLLDAYLDGELAEAQKNRLEAHLAGCQRCRALFEQGQALSSLLQEFPPASGLKPELEFLMQVRRDIRHRERARKAELQLGQLLRLGWQFAPVGLLLAWIFLQSVSFLSNILAFIPGVEQVLKGHVTSLAQAPGVIESGFLGWFNLFGFPGLLTSGGLTNLILLACFGLLYLGWMASWWARSQRNNGFRQVKQETVR
jgi:anti-sigma factor RsiW